MALARIVCLAPGARQYTRNGRLVRDRIESRHPVDRYRERRIDDGVAWPAAARRPARDGLRRCCNAGLAYREGSPHGPATAHSNLFGTTLLETRLGRTWSCRASEPPA